MNLLPLCYWYELLDLIFFFKITHGFVNVDPSVKYRRTTYTTTNIDKYIANKCRTTTYQKFFLVRVCRIGTFHGACIPQELFVTNWEAYKAPRDIKTKKAAGPDGIPSVVLKLFALELAQVVADLYN